MKIMLMWMQRW